MARAVNGKLSAVSKLFFTAEALRAQRTTIKRHNSCENALPTRWLHFRCWTVGPLAAAAARIYLSGGTGRAAQDRVASFGSSAGR